MKVAAMQPYFFPYLGYFSLLKHTDRFIIFDIGQYISQGWIARNRILKDSGWAYINVPLHAHSRDMIIKDVRINNEFDWKKKILNQIHNYPKRTPYLSEVEELCKSLFLEEYNDIVSLNVKALELVLEYLGISRHIEVLSKMDLEIEHPNDSDEWALNICRALKNVDEYWNPPGGKTFYDRSKYERVGIKLYFQEVVLTQYDQRRDHFEPGLSILDVMLFNPVDDINKMLDNYTLS